MFEAFINPWMLAGAAGAAVPVVIHLLVRRRFKRVPWAAMELLLRAFKKTRRRLRMENLLILLLRMAVIILAAIAVARPVIRTSTVVGRIGDSNRAVFLVVDNSYSMKYKRGQQSVYEAAKKAAAEILDGLKPGSDSASLIFASDSPVVVFAEPTPEIERVKEALGDSEPSFGASALAPAVDRLVEIIRGSSLASTPNKEVYFITDSQRLAWVSDRDLGSAEITGKMKQLAPLIDAFAIIEVGDGETGNAAVTSLKAEDSVIGLDKPCTFTATVANHNSSAEDLYVEFLQDGNAIASTHLSVPPGGVSTASFLAVFKTPGAHYVSARIGADALEPDNERFCAVNVRKNIRVLLVDGEPASEVGEGVFSGETANIELALLPSEDPGSDSSTMIRPEAVRHFELSAQVFAREWDLVILANEGRTIVNDSALAEALFAFVRAGGSLLVFLGDKIRSEDYNEKFWQDGEGILPLKLTRVAGDPNDPVGLNPMGRRHPLFSAFEDPGFRGLLTMPLTFQYFGMDAPDPLPEGVTVPAWFGRGAPAIAEKTYGRGKVMVVSTSADAEWSDLPAQPIYLPLVHEMVFYLVREEASSRNPEIGQSMTCRITRAQYSEDVTLSFPRGGKMGLEPPKEMDEGQFQVSFGPLTEPGPHELEVKKSGGAQAYRNLFCANVDQDEADLTRLNQEMTETLLPPEMKNKVAFSRESFSRQRRAEPEGSELWRAALVALLCLLALETLLAQRFGDFSR